VSYENLFDVLVLLFFVAAFILGYIQGAVRRLIGIVAVLFSFVLAAQLSRHLGGYLATYWTNWPAEYSFMLAFLGLFVGLVAIFAILTETTYEKGALLPQYKHFDPILGGILGVVEAGIILGAMIVIFDSWYQLPRVDDVNGEIAIIAALERAMNVSAIVHFYRTALIPAYFSVFGILIPSQIKAVFPS
jgi:uncharacterized membrane protein required for colicin V production